MVYDILIRIIRIFLRLVNGKPHYEYDEAYNPDQRYLVVATHRSLMDPVLIGLALMPRQIAFMAKEELFAVPILGWLLPKINVFPVNRDQPGAATIKHAVKILKANDKHLGMFPTGSRYENKIKPGAVSLAKMGDAELLPIVYQGPLKFSGVFSHKPENRIKLRIGKPIQLPEQKRLSKEDMAAIEQQIALAFVATDQALDPDYHYDTDQARAERDARRAQKNK